jgi:HD-like signal output (HDOD) protein
VHRGARTPEERVHRERRELGVDHALVGGVLIRRWGLPKSIATPIERHHNPDEIEGEAAFIRLADMLAHYEQGARVSPTEMLQTARARRARAAVSCARDV